MSEWAAVFDAETGIDGKAARDKRRGVNERTATYHLFAPDDARVYVGVTNNIARRMEDHKGKVWWHQVARREVTWFDNRPDALLAERRTVIAALRGADSDASLRAAIILAGRVGWSKYMIADELKIPAADADVMLTTVRKAGLVW